MAGVTRTPWEPDRAWADPLLAGLVVVAALLVMLGALAQRKVRQRPPEQVSLAARLDDRLRGASSTWSGASTVLPPAGNPWDRALGAVALAERGRLVEARVWALDGPLPAGPSGTAFRAAWRRAYLGEGTPIPQDAMGPLQEALGGGWASHALALRLAERDGRDSAPLSAILARRAERTRWILVALGLGGLAALGMGVVTAFRLMRRPPEPRPLPLVAMSGRALLILLLSWFIGSQLAALPVMLGVQLIPGLQPFALPLQYLLHAGIGIGLLALGEGLRPMELLGRLLPRPPRGLFSMSLGFFGLALGAVLLVALLLGPMLPKGADPQQELQQILAGTSGALPLLLLLTTVALLAPLFEEMVFRGVVLGWLAPRMPRRLSPRLQSALAVTISGLAFGLIHLQPLALPTLTTLGIVLGAALLGTRSLWTCVAVHALWNASVFLVNRLSVT